MTRSRLACAGLGLGLGLVFYVAYRTDQTLGNRLVGYVVGPSAYVHLKHTFRSCLPMPLALRGCLPGALWCFILTSLVGGWHVRLTADAIVPFAWLAPLFNALWEVVQWLGWTDGRADWQDAVAGFFGWGLARAIFYRSAPTTVALSALAHWRIGIVLAGFACMGLADVWR